MPKVWMDRAEAEEFLRKSKVGRLGLCTKGEPYVVPVLFVYSDGKIYFHSSSRGRKITALRENPRVCFEVDEYGGIRPAPKACSFSLNYKSVIISGEARLIHDVREKLRALTLLMEKYGKGHPWGPLGEVEARKVEVVEIRVSELRGKKNVPS